MTNRPDDTKKVNRIASIVYLLLMIFLMVGTHFSEQRKAQQREVRTQIEQGIVISTPTIDSE